MILSHGSECLFWSRAANAGRLALKVAWRSTSIQRPELTIVMNVSTALVSMARNSSSFAGHADASMLRKLDRFSRPRRPFAHAP